MLHLIVVLSALCAVTLGCPSIVSRAAWGARPPRCNSPVMQSQRPMAIIHHTVTPSCYSLASCKRQLLGMQNYHMNSQKWCDIGYNFLIGEDGQVYEGRGWYRVGVHAGNVNPSSIGIAFIGNFSNRLPNSKAINAAKNLIQCAVSRNRLRSNYALRGHRNVMNTACPGNTLYRNILAWKNFRA
ncbi:peptidoglycan recognition protein 1 [Microcaecilia unicolor]|uniref:Peptidoglycan-recognition protein n=1 Tax=Microcaecilia unicolor TaxID=1415580 RepID=A0A6P7ZCS4_9AMPH|nr:peptidoglycan recognition protein 1 [Microcaecilia unicolor]